jgi:5-formaminoimidazole-4-carboxamide-1-beta-D-ribofuranosyl 5'-monophosphate synthetase
MQTAEEFLILRDAMRYRKALAKAPEVNRQVQAKPAMAKGGKRADPNARVSSDQRARSERLRKDGSLENGVARLMDLID